MLIITWLIRIHNSYSYCFYMTLQGDTNTLSSQVLQQIQLNAAAAAVAANSSSTNQLNNLLLTNNTGMRLLFIIYCCTDSSDEIVYFYWITIIFTAQITSYIGFLIILCRYFQDVIIPPVYFFNLPLFSVENVFFYKCMHSYLDFIYFNLKLYNMLFTGYEWITHRVEQFSM